MNQMAFLRLNVMIQYLIIKSRLIGFFLKLHLSANCIIHGMNSLQFFWPNIELQSVDIHSIMQEEAYWLFAQGEYIDIRMVFGEFQKMEIILNDS